MKPILLRDLLADVLRIVQSERNEDFQNGAVFDRELGKISNFMSLACYEAREYLEHYEKLTGDKQRRETD